MKVKVTAVDSITGDEVVIGSFPQGVVIEANALIDCGTHETLLVKLRGESTWVPFSQFEAFNYEGVKPSSRFRRIHVQGA